MMDDNAKIQRLRELGQVFIEIADYLREHPSLPVPTTFWMGTETFSICYVDDRAELQAVARELGSAIKGFDDDSAWVSKKFGPVELRYYVSRNEVCERVVTGTREVVKQVPTAFEAQTVVEEIVEWRCDDSILAPEPEVSL